jgi:hypothetical protein
MTVMELIKKLNDLPSDAVVIQSRDAEGNGFSPVADVGIGRYEAENDWSGEMKLDKLTPELEKQGYSEEDVGDGPIAICFWPTN